MDYNYVRMRNALKDGDLAKVEEYKKLYEEGNDKDKERGFSALDCILAVLLSLSVLLGVYILHWEQKAAEYQTAFTHTEVMK